MGPFPAHGRDLDWTRSAIPHPDAVELALWCHDVIYVPGVPGASDHAQRSVDWFLHWVPGRIAESERVADMNLATTHTVVPDNPDARFTADIDLADLGSDRACFVRDEANLRAERPDLDDTTYDRRVHAFLSALLVREHIYHTHVFRARCEARARSNLAWRLAQLAAG